MNDPTFCIALLLRDYDISVCSNYFGYGKAIECDPDDVLMGFAICDRILKSNQRITVELFEEIRGNLEAYNLFYETVSPLNIPTMFLKTNHNNGQAKLICNALETAYHTILSYNKDISDGVLSPNTPIDIIVKGSSSEGDRAGKAYPIMAYVLDSAGVKGTIKCYDPYETTVKYNIGDIVMEHTSGRAPVDSDSYCVIDDIWINSSMIHYNKSKVFNQKAFVVSPKEMQPFFLDKQHVEIRKRSYVHSIDYRCGCYFDRDRLSCLECSYVEDLLQKLDSVRISKDYASSAYMSVLRTLIFSYDDQYSSKCGIRNDYYSPIYRMYIGLHKHDFLMRDCDESYKTFGITHRYAIGGVAKLSHPDSFDRKVFSSIQWCSALAALYRHRRKTTVLDKIHIHVSDIHSVNVGVMGSATTQGIMSEGFVLVTDDPRNIPQAELMSTTKIYGAYCVGNVTASGYPYYGTINMGTKVSFMSNYIEFADDILKFDSIYTEIELRERCLANGFSMISSSGIRNILFSNGKRDRDKELRFRRQNLGMADDDTDFKGTMRRLIKQLNNGDAMSKMSMSQISAVARSVLD